MSFGIGERVVTGYGDADSWGGPVNGIDVESQMGGPVAATKGINSPSDRWIIGIIFGSMAALWFLGAVGFKSARM